MSASDRTEPSPLNGTRRFVAHSPGTGQKARPARDRIPAAFFLRDYVPTGPLAEAGYQVGVYTGSILKGAKPADLPVLQSTKFDFVINLQTARTLGVEVPSGVLSIADEVIE
jgi:putative ABC transport system substrate-binding protein